MKHLNHFLRALLLMLLCAFSLAFTAHAQSADNSKRMRDREQLATLSGTYASSAIEPWYGAWGRREFAFDQGRWSLKFVFALDPAMQMRVFEFRTLGTYYVGTQNKAVPEAFDTLFLEDQKFVTLLTPDTELAKKFGFGNCGLTNGVEKDISVSGCANWKPVAMCNQDHDLLAIDAKGGINFGVRPMDNDMCSHAKRPKALLQAVVKQ
jgi:hypothetical protein